MKKRMLSFVCVAGLLSACGKKESKPSANEQSRVSAESSVVTNKPVKVSGTGISLPAGTKISITDDKLEGRVELPPGYLFIGADDDERISPVHATYSCNCSESKNSCKVFYAEEMGFGCLQNTCSGTCTGKFEVKGNTVNRVVSTTDKLAFFSLPEVGARIRNKCGTIEPSAETPDPSQQVYVKQQVYGISYYLLLNKKSIPRSLNDAEQVSSKASCKCKDSKFCKLETVDLPMLKAGDSKIKIYFCDGSCNGCELTVE